MLPLTAISALKPPTVVVVDHFYEEPDKVRSYALQQEFKEHPKYHKGKRTERQFLFPGLKERFEEILGREIVSWDKYGVNGCFQICVAGEPVVYHFDAQEYAGVVYLTPEAPLEGGTQLLQSRSTGKMKITDDSEHQRVFSRGYLDPTLFNVVDTVGNQFNRLVLWDAKVFHCAQSYFGNSNENGRLFQLFFFDVGKPLKRSY